MNRMLRNQYIFDGSKSVSLSSASEWDWLTGTSGESDYSSDLTALQAYRLVPYVYRAVDLRARAVSSMPWTLQRVRGTISEDVTTSPGYRTLTRGMRMRLYETEAALCLYGAAYWLKEANRMGFNLAARWVLPSSMQPRYDARHGLVGFERFSGGGVQRLDLDDVVYIWQPSLSAEVGPGVAPVQVALPAAGVLHNLDRFADGFFRRGAIKATLLSVEGNPSRAELERLESWWRRLVSGVRRAWESIAIRSTVKPVVIGDGLKEAADEVLTTQRREDVCAALGVPHSLISADAANYATSQNDKITFLTGTVIPACRQIEEVLNEQLFGEMGLRFMFNPALLEEMQQYEVMKAQALAALVGQPIYTVNEARALMGLPPLAGGDGLQLGGNGHLATSEMVGAGGINATD